MGGGAERERVERERVDRREWERRDNNNKAKLALCRLGGGDSEREREQKGEIWRDVIIIIKQNASGE